MVSELLTVIEKERVADGDAAAELPGSVAAAVAVDTLQTDRTAGRAGLVGAWLRDSALRLRTLAAKA